MAESEARRLLRHEIAPDRSHEPKASADDAESRAEPQSDNQGDFPRLPHFRPTRSRSGDEIPYGFRTARRQENRKSALPARNRKQSVLLCRQPRAEGPVCRPWPRRGFGRRSPQIIRSSGRIRSREFRCAWQWPACTSCRSGRLPCRRGRRADACGNLAASQPDQVQRAG